MHSFVTACLFSKVMNINPISIWSFTESLAIRPLLTCNTLVLVIMIKAISIHTYEYLELFK